MIENLSNKTMDLYKYELYNVGCIDENRKVAELCTQFKVDVLNSVNHRFEIAIILLCIFIILQFTLRYGFKEYLEYKNYILYQFVLKRIDWITILLAISVIALMFF